VKLINVEDWVTLKNLKKRKPALGTRAIAKLLGISCNTGKIALKSEDIPTYERRREINPEIKPFQEYSCVRFLVKGLKGSRVLKEIISKAYKGSKSAFYKYILELSLKLSVPINPTRLRPANSLN
jgi:hypothetical protein